MENKVIYKTGVIDYQRTMENLEPGRFVEIPQSSPDISNIRANVCKAARFFPDARFEVHKTLNGARIDRIQ